MVDNNDIVEDVVVEEDQVFERNVVWVVESEKPRVTRESLEAVSPELFRMDKKLVRVMPNSNGGVEFCPITVEALDNMLNETIRYMKVVIQGRGDGREPVEVDTAAPPWLAKQILGLQQWDHVRDVETVCRVPFLRADGSVGGMTYGYDSLSKCWAEVQNRKIEVPDSPTDEQAKEAMHKLLSLVSEFPFETPAAKAAYLAAILTVVGRRAIDGQVPLLIIESPAAGTGKTLLARVIAVIGTGQEPGMAKGSGDGVELEKFLTAFLLTGNSVLTFDNVVDKFGGDVIDRFATAPTWTSRRLGKTETITVRNSTCCIVTANNARVEGDTVRRSIQIRLVANCERPFERTFDVPDLMKHVKICQEDLTCAAITILRWHQAKGCPTYATATHVDPDGNESEVDVRPLGSFEAWGRLVRHAVIGLGLPDPATTAETIRSADEKTLGQKAFVRAWFAFKPDWVGTAKDLIDEIYPAKESDFSQAQYLRYAIENLLKDKLQKSGPPRPADLGLEIRSLRDKVFDDVAVRGGKHVEAGTQWTLERLTKEDS